MDGAGRLDFAEGRKVERLARPEPDGMLRMICAIVSGAGMRKNRQPVAVEGDPSGEFPELLGLDRQLTASSGMRPDGIAVETADGNTEALLGGFRKALGTVDLVGVEIDVRVKVADRLLGHGARLAESGFPCEKRRL